MNLEGNLVSSGFVGQVLPSRPHPERGFKGDLSDLVPCQLVYIEFLGKEERSKKYILISEVTESSLKGFVVGEGANLKEIPLGEILTIQIRATEVNEELFDWMNFQLKKNEELEEKLTRIKQRFAELLE